MKYNKTQVIFALFGVLALFYAINIFLTKNVSGVLVDVPAKVSFAIMEAPRDGCENCFDADRVIKMVDNAHNIKYKSREIAYDSSLSRKYIEMYEIKNLPAIIVSGDIENEKVTPAWSALSGQKRGDRIIIENLLPYYDIESGEVRGVISAILVKDETCQDCFDENQYITILGRFGVGIGDVATHDITSLEGRELVRKYSISKVPTLILSPDAGEYRSLASSWSEVGTIAEDGWFIFREVQKLNPQYKEI